MNLLFDTPLLLELAESGLCLDTVTVWLAFHTQHAIVIHAQTKTCYKS